MTSKKKKSSQSANKRVFKSRIKTIKRKNVSSVNLNVLETKKVSEAGKPI